MQTRRRQSGFSLIELLVVVAIMLVVAAIAIPAAIASRQSGNESSAASTLRQVVTAETGYAQLYNAGYSALASDLGMTGGTSACPNTPSPETATPPVNTIAGACLLADGVAQNLDAGTVAINNYLFTYAGTAGSYTQIAVPATGTAGRKSYCVDNSGTIVYAWGLTAPVGTGKCKAVDGTAVFALGS
jgi:type IV pilus assembly protein PilA